MGKPYFKSVSDFMFQAFMSWKILLISLEIEETNNTKCSHNVT